MLRSDIPPALEVYDGDTVLFNTVMLMEGRLSPEMSFDEMYAVRIELKDRGLGTYAFTGPFFVKGAEPGDVLQVDILRIRPGSTPSLTSIGFGRYGRPSRGFGKGWLKPLRLSEDRRTIEYAPGIVLPVRPFLGTMTVAPGPARSCPPPSPATSPVTWTTRSSSPGRPSSSP